MVALIKDRFLELNALYQASKGDTILLIYSVPLGSKYKKLFSLLSIDVFRDNNFCTLVKLLVNSPPSSCVIIKIKFVLSLETFSFSILSSTLSSKSTPVFNTGSVGKMKIKPEQNTNTIIIAILVFFGFIFPSYY